MRVCVCMYVDMMYEGVMHVTLVTSVWLMGPPKCFCIARVGRCCVGTSAFNCSAVGSAHSPSVLIACVHPVDKCVIFAGMHDTHTHTHTHTHTRTHTHDIYTVHTHYYRHHHHHLHRHYHHHLHHHQHQYNHHHHPMQTHTHTHTHTHAYTHTHIHTHIH